MYCICKLLLESCSIQCGSIKLQSYTVLTLYIIILVYYRIFGIINILFLTVTCSIWYMSASASSSPGDGHSGKTRYIWKRYIERFEYVCIYYRWKCEYYSNKPNGSSSSTISCIWSLAEFVANESEYYCHVAISRQSQYHNTCFYAISKSCAAYTPWSCFTCTIEYLRLYFTSWTCFVKDSFIIFFFITTRWLSN